jgi:acyl-CoA thioesterase-2
METDVTILGVAELWNDLIACLDLAEVPGDAFLEGKNLPLDYHRLFGGQLLAQFAIAAARTCTGKMVKSMHVLFPREGTADEPVRYEVVKHSDGRSFAALTILARQARGVIGTASVSMHGAEEGRSAQSVVPVRETPWDSEPVQIGLLPFETRAAADLDAREAAPPEYSLWFRTPKTDQGLAQALAAYTTDLTLIGTALRAVNGVSQADAQKAFASAVTSHTIWFHRPFETSDWLVLRQEGPILAHGRAFGRGDILTADGSLVASYAQESLVRFKTQP